MQISTLIQQYKVEADYYYYYTGLAYYDKQNYDQSVKYYQKAYGCLQELNKAIYKLHNSTGITYDDKKINAKAIEYYGKAIAANPKYHSAYYNTAIVYKREKKE